jgi:polyhydroxyalkanoate synthase subunit PhaC
MVGMASPGEEEQEGQVFRNNVKLLGVDDYDNPETIRFKKYATGLQLISDGTRIQVGQTPGKVIWAKGRARLHRYEPEKDKKHPVPVLLVYALILRPYILDLVPGNSLIEYLVGEGFDVYLLDWGVPEEEDKNLSFDNYVLDYLPEAAGQILRTSNTEKLTLFGYCQGGTIAAMHAALFPEGPLKNLVLLATPVDFAPEDPGLFGLWTVLTSGKYFDPSLLFDPDPVVEACGNVPADLPGRLVEAGTSAFEPLASRAASYAKLWERMGRERSLESLLAVSKWVDDGVPFSGEAFRRWIKDFYQQNKLAKGELELRGRLVDLSKIEVPLLNVAGSKHYICPVSQAEPTMDLVGSEDKELLVLDAGHVGLMAGPIAKENLWPRIRNWLEPRSG